MPCQFCREDYPLCLVNAASTTLCIKQVGLRTIACTSLALTLLTSRILKATQRLKQSKP